MPKYCNPAFGMTNTLTKASNDVYPSTAKGRWARDPGTATTSTAFYLKAHPDQSTIDIIRLNTGVDGWTDLGGQGGWDVVVGRI